MADALEVLKALGPALMDAWYVVDESDRIVEFNSVFHAMFPRAVARTLKGAECRRTLDLPPCRGDRCLRRACAESGSMRLDEVDVELGGERLRLIIGASPITLPGGGKGAVVVLRNVTDEARVQTRYQEMLEQAERERRELDQRVAARTKELLAANDVVTRLEQELAELKRGR